jgi:integrase
LLSEIQEAYAKWYAKDRKAMGYNARSLEVLTTVLKSFEGWRALDLTHAKLKEWRDGRKGKVANSTLVRQFTALRSMLDYAAGKFIDSNPVAGFKLDLKTKNAPKHGKALSRDQEDRLRAAVAKRTDYLGSLVLVGLGTGMRRGELFGMRWRDVNLTAATIEVPKSKSGVARTVNIGVDTVEVLKAWRDGLTKPGRHDDKLVFPGADGKSQLVTIKTSWETLKTDAKIPNARFHSLRHTFATRHLNAGTPIFAVARWLGHSTEKTTEIYGHADVEGAAKYVENVRS